MKTHPESKQLAMNVASEGSNRGYIPPCRHHCIPNFERKIKTQRLSNVVKNTFWVAAYIVKQVIFVLWLEKNIIVSIKIGNENTETLWNPDEI